MGVEYQPRPLRVPSGAEVAETGPFQVEKSALFKQYKSKYYVIFSKSGFTRELEEAAGKMGNVGLVDLKKLYDEI